MRRSPAPMRRCHAYEQTRNFKELQEAARSAVPACGDGWGGGDWGDAGPAHGGDGSMVGEDANDEEGGAGNRRLSRHHAGDGGTRAAAAAASYGGGRPGYR